MAKMLTRKSAKVAPQEAEFGQQSDPGSTSTHSSDGTSHGAPAADKYQVVDNASNRVQLQLATGGRNMDAADAAHEERVSLQEVSGEPAADARKSKWGFFKKAAAAESANKESRWSRLKSASIKAASFKPVRCKNAACKWQGSKEHKQLHEEAPPPPLPAGAQGQTCGPDPQQQPAL